MDQEPMEENADCLNPEEKSAEPMEKNSDCLNPEVTSAKSVEENADCLNPEEKSAEPVEKNSDCLNPEVTSAKSVEENSDCLNPEVTSTKSMEENADCLNPEEKSAIPSPKMAVNLLLVGRNGNGKSSTGNSILGKKVFSPQASSQSIKDEIKKGTAVVDGKEINVVEGPGIGDTNVNDIDDVKLTLSNVETALGLCPDGFNAIVFILKYGVRFTKQEIDTVSLIKSIFGENVFKDYGVIVMTYGDSFAMDMEEENITFETWCKEQTGAIKELFGECRDRYVLFNNRAKDELSLRAQRDILMKIIDKLPASPGPYTLTEYRKAEAGRKRILIASKLPQLQVENRRVLYEINDSAKKIDVNSDSSVMELEALQQKTNKQKQQINDEAGGTDLMKYLLEEIKITEVSLKTKMERAALEKERRKHEHQYLPPADEHHGLPEPDETSSSSPFDETTPILRASQSLKHQPSFFVKCLMCLCCIRKYNCCSQW